METAVTWRCVLNGYVSSCPLFMFSHPSSSFPLSFPPFLPSHSLFLCLSLCFLAATRKQVCSITYSTAMVFLTLDPKVMEVMTKASETDSQDKHLIFPPLKIFLWYSVTVIKCLTNTLADAPCIFIPIQVQLYSQLRVYSVYSLIKHPGYGSLPVILFFFHAVISGHRHSFRFTFCS